MEHKRDWRVIITDTESPTGVAPVCDKDHSHYDVYDCCPQPHLETYDELAAEKLAALLSELAVELCP